jgi:hypothetical protein
MDWPAGAVFMQILDADGRVAHARSHVTTFAGNKAQ